MCPLADTQGAASAGLSPNMHYHAEDKTAQSSWLFDALIGLLIGKWSKMPGGATLKPVTRPHT